MGKSKKELQGAIQQSLQEIEEMNAEQESTSEDYVTVTMTLSASYLPNGAPSEDLREDLRQEMRRVIGQGLLTANPVAHLVHWDIVYEVGEKMRFSVGADGHVSFDRGAVTWKLHHGGWEAFHPGEDAPFYETREVKLPTARELQEADEISFARHSAGPGR